MVQVVLPPPPLLVVRPLEKHFFLCVSSLSYYSLFGMLAIYVHSLKIDAHQRFYIDCNHSLPINDV